jgi:hypothetical protein
MTKLNSQGSTSSWEVFEALNVHKTFVDRQNLDINVDFPLRVY